VLIPQQEVEELLLENVDITQSNNNLDNDLVMVTNDMQQQGIASPSTPGISLVHHNHNLRGLI
jgi:hypothetical protein